MNFAVKSGFRPSFGPLVLDSHSELRSLTTEFYMEIKATILSPRLNSINLYLPRLIVELISFHEAFSGRNTHEACNCPHILRQLNDGIGGELMYMYLEFS
jgi:hypothetical protein